jgi:hypothetical protein
MSIKKEQFFYNLKRQGYIWWNSKLVKNKWFKCTQAFVKKLYSNLTAMLQVTQSLVIELFQEN